MKAIEGEGIVVVKEKVMDLANKISGTKRGSRGEIKPDQPEYYILEPVVSNEMAEVALCLELHKPLSARTIAVRCKKPLAETEKLLWELSDAGVCCLGTTGGVDQYWLEIWPPGIMEHMVNNKKNLEKYPRLVRPSTNIPKTWASWPPVSAMAVRTGGNGIFTKIATKIYPWYGQAKPMYPYEIPENFEAHVLYFPDINKLNDFNQSLYESSIAYHFQRFPTGGVISMTTESNDELYALLQGIPQDMMDAIGTHGATCCYRCQFKRGDGI